MDRLTDVIQKPAVAFRTIQVLRTIVEEQEKEIEQLKARGINPVVPEPPRGTIFNPIFIQCGKAAPSSKACKLGKECRCIQAEGHTTPHRAKCGARWANRKRS